jgi:hypothetical protein
MRSRVAFGARAFVAMALLFGALVFGPSQAFAVRTLGLSAGTFHFDLSAGQQAGGEVVVMNDGTEPLKVMVYASDMKVDEKGNVTYQTPTRADLTSIDLPSAWTTIKMPANSKSLGNIPYLELKPKQNIPVKFSITVPPTVAPGDHNVILFFESFEAPKPGQGARSVVSGRLGARVTLRVAGELVHKIEVRPFNVPAYVIGGVIPYDFTVRNTGNVDQRIGAIVRLLDRTDNEVQKTAAIDGVTVFAGTNKEATGTLLADKLPIGPFKVRIDVSPVDDAGKAMNSGADTITQSHEVWLIPFWLPVLVGVLVLLVFIRIVWVIAAGATRRRAQREQERAAAAEAQARPFPDSEYHE